MEGRLKYRESVIARMELWQIPLQHTATHYNTLQQLQNTALTNSTENATPPNSLKFVSGNLRNSNFSIQIKKISIWICTARYRGIWVSRYRLVQMGAFNASNVRPILIHACGAADAEQCPATHCNLQDSAKHWKTLPDTARHCNTLQHSTRHCNTLQHTASQTHWNTLHHTATRCNTLQHTATHTAIHCNTLRHKQTETHCTALQHAVTHCNTLQHTAIHYITLDTLTPRLRGGKCKALGNTLFFSSCIDPTVKT